MGYRLRNLYTGESYCCSDEFWLDALKLAAESGWEPKKTTLSLDKEIDDAFDETYGTMYNLYIVLSAHARCLEWDGNYKEKEYQIVSLIDACNMMEELIYCSADPDFLDFLSKGAFEIGPD